MELRNFEHAGEVLAEIWSSMQIDGYATKAQYVHPSESERQNVEQVTAEWKRNHVREGHYFLQVPFYKKPALAVNNLFPCLLV